MKHKYWNRSLMLAVCLIALLCVGCHNHMYDGKAVVTKVERGSFNYKYKVTVDFFAVDQIVYTNKEFKAGDVISVEKAMD